VKKLSIILFAITNIVAYGISSPDSVTLDLSGSYGGINGFISTPKGGQFGSSDYNRPTFDEMGIDNNFMYNVQLNTTYGDWTYYGKYSGMNFKNTTSLSNSLITHGYTLDKGTEYTVDTPTQFINIGVMKKYKISEKLSLSPLVEFSMQRTSYTWSATSSTFGITNPDGNNINSADDTRGYFNLWAPAIGGQLDYKFTEKTKLSALGKSIIPIGTSWKYYFYGSIKLSHSFYSNNNTWLNQTEGYVGVEAYTTKSRDSQEEMQNWIEITQAPMVTLGMIIHLR